MNGGSFSEINGYIPSLHSWILLIFASVRRHKLIVITLIGERLNIQYKYTVATLKYQKYCQGELTRKTRLISLLSPLHC